VLPADESAGNGGPLHLLKMAVGVGSLDELRQARAARIKQHGGSWVYTRNHPRRAEAVLAGGSLFWVIRGQVRVRQLVTGFRSERDEKGRAYCLIEVEPLLVPTLWRPWRPFQGWRYLTPSDAPADVPHGRDAAEVDAAAPMPSHMLAELRALGLI
jgi:hypothetical protein